MRKVSEPDAIRCADRTDGDASEPADDEFDPGKTRPSLHELAERSAAAFRKRRKAHAPDTRTTTHGSEPSVKDNGGD